MKLEAMGCGETTEASTEREGERVPDQKGAEL